MSDQFSRLTAMTCPACRNREAFELNYRRTLKFTETPELRANPDDKDCRCGACGHEGPLFMFSPVFEEDPDAEKYSIHVKPDDRISTCGGESWFNDCQIDDYGLAIGDFHLHGLTSAQMAKLASVIVDHVSLNGHVFKLEKCRDRYDNTERTVLTCEDIVIGKRIDDQNIPGSV